MDSWRDGWLADWWLRSLIPVGLAWVGRPKVLGLVAPPALGLVTPPALELVAPLVLGIVAPPVLGLVARHFFGLVAPVCPVRVGGAIILISPPFERWAFRTSDDSWITLGGTHAR